MWLDQTKIVKKKTRWLSVWDVKHYFDRSAVKDSQPSKSSKYTNLLFCTADGCMSEVQPSLCRRDLKFVNCMHCVCEHVNCLTKQVCPNSNASDLYFGGASFDSRLWHQLSWGLHPVRRFLCKNSKCISVVLTTAVFCIHYPVIQPLKVMFHGTCISSNK